MAASLSLEDRDTMGLAIAYIEAGPGADMRLVDIARAASVTPRAVQRAFRRTLDTTPTAYLRGTRLRRAHRQLLDAVPGDGLTVTEVSYHWGFANPSRFASDYRAAYGHPPSQSLRS